MHAVRSLERTCAAHVCSDGTQGCPCKRCKHLKALQSRRLRLGEPQAWLPLLHYALLQFSSHVRARAISCGVEVRRLQAMAHATSKTLVKLTSCSHLARIADICSRSLACTPDTSTSPPSTAQLQGVADQRFVQQALRAVNNGLGVRPVLTVAQCMAKVGLTSTRQALLLSSYSRVSRQRRHPRTRVDERRLRGLGTRIGPYLSHACPPTAATARRASRALQSARCCCCAR